MASPSTHARVGAVVVLLSIALQMRAGTVSATDFGSRAGTLWAPFLEWSLEDPSISGNPFDVAATATFVHAESGEVRTTAMFYDGGTTFRFRFTATRSGEWTFTTASADPDLDGHSGVAVIAENPDPRIRGYIVAAGNRFARQTGPDGALEGYLHNVFQDEVDLRTSAIWGQGLARWADPGLVQALMDQVEENGFNTLEIELEHQLLALNAARYTDHDSEEPDLLAFRIVEDMIVAAGQRGFTVRLFMWGDESRSMTPAGLPGGINGFVDQRLQRYIGARLGPLPGWTMNYGFDLEEWVTESEVEDWAARLHQSSGWRHLLAARKRYANLEVDLEANDDRPESGFYQNAVDRLENAANRPAVFDRRFIYLRDGVWDTDTTRRALWQFTLAGGAGSVWGHEGIEYPRKDQLRTHLAFWLGHHRFDLELARDNSLTPSGWALATPGSDRFIFYDEQTASMQMDLSAAPGPLPAVYVDTRAGYEETFVGYLPPGVHTIALPQTSDWAIAVGVFGRDGDGDGIAEDGDGSGIPGDGPCAPGDVANCDDNCPRIANALQADGDGDGFGDVCDACIATASATALDSDGDGYGNACDADYDDSGRSGALDYLEFRARFGSIAGDGRYREEVDSDGDGVIGGADFAVFRALFGTAPGPSGLACAGSPPCPGP